ncbi:50S ribosomal protein L22 [soil metagenome]
MEVKATAKQIRISPRKVRVVADGVRNMSVDNALTSLRVINRRGASILVKTLESAIANAQNNAKLDRAKLEIASIIVSEGPSLKRYHASTRGRIHPYKKRSSTVSITLKEAIK